MLLENKTCVIVGASGAIGGAVAQRFVQEGARLCLTYHAEPPRSLADQLRAGGGKAGLYRLELGEWQQVQSGISQMHAEFPDIDVLVNCAGVIGPIGRLEDSEVAEWTRTLQIDFLGAVYLARAILPAFRRRGRGKIIFFSGGGGAYGRPYFTAYSSAKAALVRFTESLAEEVRDAGIQVNAVAPGPVRSRMWDEMKAAGAAGGPKLLEDLRRMEETGGESPDRAAALAVFLASDRSNHVTGKLISAVWDDWEAIANHPCKLANAEAWTLRRVPLQQP